MALRPTQVQWFEARVPRDRAVHALEVLAGAGQVELETGIDQNDPCVDSAALNGLIGKFDTLQRRISDELPSVDGEPVRQLQQPVATAEKALETLRTWHLRDLALHREMHQIENERETLSLLQAFLQAAGDHTKGIDGMYRESGFLVKHIFACPKGTLADKPDASGSYNEVFPSTEQDFWLVVSEPEHARILDGTAALLQCKRVVLPAWLPADPTEQRRLTETRLRQCDEAQAALTRSLLDHRNDPDVRQAQSTMRLLRWYARHTIRHDSDHRSCRLSGWTLYPNPGDMEQILQQEQIEANVVFCPPRGNLKPPVYLSRNTLAKPFHHFIGLSGTPGHQEVDPTPLLAFLVPLLFGFMFPDLGHGLILALIGLLGARKYPAAAILIPCGLSAAAFGLLFGEFFGATGLLPALCGCPLEHPRETLIATLILGFAITLLGLIFSGLEYYWRGELGRWMLEGAPVIALYLSAALSFIWRESLYFTLAAALWYLLGIAVLCHRRTLANYLDHLGRLLQSTFQLATHTLSFLRVGAFALAHGALSMVVIHLSQSVDAPLLQGAIFFFGQIAITLIEGLIVMIQTTRLILFEFFIHFLRFEGRIYKPLESPYETDKGRNRPASPRPPA